MILLLYEISLYEKNYLHEFYILGVTHHLATFILPKYLKISLVLKEKFFVRVFGMHEPQIFLLFYFNNDQCITTNVIL